MSIVRVGLSETKGFGDGYDAIFGKKKSAAKSTAAKKSVKKAPPKKPATVKAAAASKAVPKKHTAGKPQAKRKK